MVCQTREIKIPIKYTHTTIVTILRHKSNVPQIGPFTANGFLKNSCIVVIDLLYVSCFKMSTSIIKEIARNRSWPHSPVTDHNIQHKLNLLHHLVGVVFAVLGGWDRQ